MTDSPFHPGTVDWSGDNPGMFLRETADGPFVTLMVYFRVTYSAYGGGHALLLFEAKDEAAQWPDRANMFLATNPELGAHLLENFCKRFGAFRDAKAFEGLTVQPMTDVVEEGDGKSGFHVTLQGEGVEVKLAWDDLGPSFAADVPPEKSATGKHEMYSCFVEAGSASITVNGRRLAGQPFPRDFMGRPTSSAFLAFSETWTLAG